MKSLIRSKEALKGWALKKVANLPIGTYRSFPVYGLIGVAHAADSPINSMQDIINVINQVGVWLATIFWIAAAASVFYAGFLYMTAADDTEKIKKAKKQVLYTIIAVVLGLMAYGLPALLRTILLEGSIPPPPPAAPDSP